jgi:hypothetical protein
MHRRTIGVWGGLTAAVLLAASPALAATGWSIASVPPTGQNAFLLGVSAASGTDAWAVGTVNRTAGSQPGPLIDHWNGTAWQPSAGPAYPASDLVSLDSVSAASATDAWAAGFTRAGGNGPAFPATAHWNGTSWSTVPAAPCLTAGVPVSSYLLGVTDVNPADAFAVGECTSHASGLIQHWNGSTWTQMALPDPNPAHPGMTQSLSSLSADGANDVWAVGLYTVLFAPTGIRYEPYSLHWNGSTWAVVPMPPVPGTDGHLVYQFHSIDAISPGNVWAVGQSGDDVGVGGTPTATLVEHWNGTAWSVVPSPTVGTSPFLNSVTATGPADVWAVGYDTPAGGTQPRTFTMHWNGTAWATVGSPTAGRASRLVSVSARPGAAIIWAAGYSGVAGSFNPLALRHG